MMKPQKSDNWGPKAIWDFKDKRTMNAAMDMYNRIHSIGIVLNKLRDMGYDMTRGLEYEPVPPTPTPVVDPKEKPIQLPKDKFVQNSLFSAEDLNGQ